MRDNHFPYGLPTQTSNLINDGQDGNNPFPTMFSENGEGVEILAGVIRNTGGTWGYISDAGHFGQSGFASINQGTALVTVVFNQNYGKVITFVATPDETYALSGIYCGASVGTHEATISIKQHRTISSYLVFNGTNWTSTNSLISVTAFSGGVLTVSHTNVKMADFSVNASMRDISSVTYAPPSIGSVGIDNFQVRMKSWDGTNFTGTPVTGTGMYVSRTVDKLLTNTDSAIDGANIWLIAVMQKS